MKQLDPKAVWIFFTHGLLALIFIIGPLLYLGFSLQRTWLREEAETTKRISKKEVIEGFQSADIPVPLSFLIFPETYWGVALFFIAFAYGWAHLSYRAYRYELRDDGFRKEHGVIWKKYVTIPYERIQNVDIYRGVIARLLGLSDLQIQTAGMSSTLGSYGAGAEGRLPGVSMADAEHLRDELVRRARGSKSSGV